MKHKGIVSLALVMSLAVPTVIMAAEDATTSATTGASATVEEPAATPAPAPAATPAPAPVATPAPSAATGKPSSSTSNSSNSSSKSNVTISKDAAGTESVNASGEVTYTVASGDTLAKIAKRYGATHQELAAYNKISNPDLIFVAQLIVIPGAKASTSAPAPSATETSTSAPDVVSSASLRESSDPNAIKANLSTNGTWIHSILSDVTIGGNIRVEGLFYSKDDVTSNIYRKLALYAQDADHNVTAEYTLKVGSLYVASPNFRIQNGKVVGDIYVDARGFNLRGSKVEGNVYFRTEAQMVSANIPEGSVTGSVEVLAFPDAVSGPTVKESTSAKALVENMSGVGYWIHSVLSDVTVNGSLNVDGVFYRSDTPVANAAPYRKLALYAQDENRKVTAEYKLNVARVNVTSPNFRIQNGTVVGDVYVDARGFELYDCTIEGNLYFKYPGQMESAKLDRGTVTGVIEVAATPDAVSGVSKKESTTADALVANMASYGDWIHSVTSDVTVKGSLNVDGVFYRNDAPAPDAAPYRKLALYAQDDSRKVTAEYVLTVDRINVTSPNFRIQNGTVVGDVYVDARGFELYDCTIEGNLYFRYPDQMAAAKLERGTVTGVVEVAATPDAVSGVSKKESASAQALINNMASYGDWIHSVTADVKIAGELNVDGEFHDKDKADNKLYRKLALYAQDDKRNVTAEYTLTVDKINVTSPAFRIQNGTVIGDIYVDADGFELVDCNVEGNVTFATLEQFESANLDTATISGNVVHP